MSKRATPSRLNALMCALMVKAMLEAPCTIADLAEITGLARHTIARYLNAMRDQKCLHVVQWEQDSLGRFVIAAYQIGAGRNAPRPKTDRIARSRRERYHLRKQMRLNAALAGSLPA